MNVREKPLAVFGLGYVGLPLSLSYSMAGYKVYGIDIAGKLINELQSGFTRHFEKYGDRSIGDILTESLKTGNFIPTDNPAEASEFCDKFIITVGIPTQGEFLDFQPLLSACTTISQGLKKGDTVIIRCTVVPGTTEEKLIPALEKSGLRAGQDFHVVYCPERISEGNAFEEFENIPVVISGINRESVSIGMEIVKLISKADPVPVSNIKVAETAKVAENIQRDVNIAIVHQFSGFCKDFGIDIFELVDAVNTHPRVNLLNPGPGVGGYCIPNALHYLTPKANELGTGVELLECSRKLNDRIPANIAGEAGIYILSMDKKLRNAKVAVLGIAMKDYCSDDRRSPVISIIQHLKDMGLTVQAFDPLIPTGYEFIASDINECVLKADLLFIGAIQQGINYNDLELFKKLMNENPILFDTRNIVNKAEAKKMGFKVASL